MSHPSHRYGIGWHTVPALILLLGLPTFARAAELTVGAPGTGCHHTNIQAAINAAHANPGVDTIRITKSAPWTQQALQIDTSQGLELIGGYDTCTSTEPTPGTTTIIDGAGGALEPVLRISVGTGGYVYLRHLTIQGGDEDGASSGGGIYYRGNGYLLLDDVLIANNTAGYGGGIAAVGTGPAAELRIGLNVLIMNNTARYSGGGIRLESMKLTMNDPGSSIYNNTAQGLNDSGYGGGILVLAHEYEASAEISSGGGGFGWATIERNTARYGGGIAVVSSDGPSNGAELRFYSRIGDQQAAVRDNQASRAGGGIFVASRGILGRTLMYNSILKQNTSPLGAAVYLASHDDSVGSQFWFNAGSTMPAPNAAPCPVGGFCGAIIDNHVPQGGFGAVMQSEMDGQMQLRRVLLHGNQGVNLFRMGVGGNISNFILISDSVLSDNVTSGSLIRTNGESASSRSLSLWDVTIAGNSIAAPHVMELRGRLRIDRSILFQPDKAAVTGDSGSSVVIEANHVLANETASFGGGPTVYLTVDPRFVDPERGDFSLQASSFAVDRAPVSPAGSGVDALGNPRDIRVVGVPRPGGLVRDLGALERQALLPIVRNGDFASDLRLWRLFAASGISWDGTENAYGPAGSGSIKIDVPNVPVGGTYVAAEQCLRLPGPGLYRLDGHARSIGLVPAIRDGLGLHWQFRRNGGTACTVGQPTSTGALFITGLASWNHSSNGADILVPEEQWTADSSVLVQLVVHDSGATQPARAQGWFDGITLEWSSLSNDVIFQNSFEQ